MTKRFTSARIPTTAMTTLFDTSMRWQCWLDVEAALARAQATLGLIPAEAGCAISACCVLELFDLDRIEAEIGRMSHPLMPLVAELSRIVGEPDGAWVHWGVTTQNVTQTGDTTLFRRAHSLIRGQLRDILVALADLADRSADMVMAGRTHGQHAVPITFGYKAAGWIDEFLRHLQRLDEIAPRLFVALLGGAAGTSASLGEHAQRLQDLVATDMGLLPMAVPSRNIVDHHAEFVTTLGLLATTTGKIGREIYQLMKTEYQEAEEPVPDGTVGSSTMPHKRNPQLSQDIIGITSEIRALTPLALESALSEHEADNNPSVLFDTQQRACELTADALSRVHVVVSGLRLNPHRMRRNLELSSGMTATEAIMLQLGRSIGRQPAHEIVYDIAQHANATAASFVDALTTDPRITAHMDSRTVMRLLTPETNLALAPLIAKEQAARARSATTDTGSR